MNALREALASSPSLFPLNIETVTDSVQFIHLSEAEYESASFLDGRILQPERRTALIPWNELQSAAQELRLNCHFIFHISHSGSTLLSRLLACHPAFFSVREPAILRLFANRQSPERLATYLKLWSRTFRPQQTSVVKATSFVSAIAHQLLSLVPQSRAILMYVPPTTFLAATLDGSMSDIDAHASCRLQRLHARGLLKDTTLESLSPGERVAMSWLSEMLTLSELANNFPTRTLWLNFDQYLDFPEQGLTAAFKHLGIVTDVGPILQNNVTRRYAKQPAVSYDSSFRSRLLAAASHQFQPEIQRGAAWLGERLPCVSRPLEQFCDTP